MISHESALLVHQVGEIIPDKISFTVSKSFRKKPPKKYLIYKADLVNKEIEKRDSFKVTNVVKTIIDVTESIDPEQLKEIVEDAYKKGLLSQDKIELSTTSSEIKRKLLSIFAQVRSKR